SPECCKPPGALRSGDVPADYLRGWSTFGLRTRRQLDATAGASRRGLRHLALRELGSLITVDSGLDLMMPQLAPKQRRLVAEYLIDLNATQAAIRAGYSTKTARSVESENLTKPDIQAAIAAGQGRQLAEVEADVRSSQSFFAARWPAGSPILEP